MASSIFCMNGWRSSASVSFGWMRLTSTAAIGFWMRPTIVTSLMVTTRLLLAYF